MLSDAGFLSRMMSFDMTSLKNSPELASFVAAEYFGAGQKWSPRRSMTKPGNSSASRGSTLGSARKNTFVEAGRRTMPNLQRASMSTSALGRSTSNFSAADDDTLSFQRVNRASQAAGALFRWCTTTLVAVMDPEPEKPKEEVTSTSAGESDRETSSSSTAPPPQELTVSATPAVPQRTPSPEPTPVPNLPQRLYISVPKKAPAPKRPALVLNAATPPDRHFEMLARFDLGSSAMPLDLEPTLQTLASTICMRPTLSLELQGCPNKMEHDALSKSRVNAVQQWFEDNGLTSTLCHQARFTESTDEPGVICRILLNRDRNLRDFYILREHPEEEQITFARDVIRDAKMLEEDFQMCKH